VLGIIEPTPFTTFLAEFGFAFLMFLAGLELDFSRIEREGIRGFLSALGIATLVFVLAFATTAALGQPFYLGIAFGAMAMGILLVTLTECGLTKTALGQTTIFVGTLGEFLTIILLSGFAIYYRLGLGWTLLQEMAKLGVIFVAAYLVLVVLRTLIWWFPSAFSRVVATKDPSEIGVRAGMATMLVFVALASLMGLKAILGAFVAGALFSAVFREKGILETKMSSIGFGFFVPIFFIGVGTDFDPAAVKDLGVLTMVGLFLVASLVPKVLACLPLLARGFHVRDVLGAALLLGAPLTMLVVIARIGVEVRVIDRTTSGALILLAIVTGVFFPWAFRLLRPGAAEAPPGAR
jgi:Kef-type K+ transport system membrane component KefB